MAVSYNDNDKKCCICGGQLGKYGNNAEPVKHGQCCDKCNNEVVIPARLSSHKTESIADSLLDGIDDLFENDVEDEAEIDAAYHDADEEELRKMGAFDNLNLDESLFLEWSDDANDVEAKVYNWLSGWYDDKVNNSSYQIQEICADIPDYDIEWASEDENLSASGLDSKAKETWLEAQMKMLFKNKPERVNEDWAEVRPNEAKLYDYIDKYNLDWQVVAEAALSYLSDDDIGDLARSNSWFDTYEDDEDDFDDDLIESVSKDTQEVVDPVMADALRDQEKAKELKDKVAKITKDGVLDLKTTNEAFNPFNALNKLEESVRRGK